MANSLTNLTPQILAQILSVLRENSIMPRLVNNQYGTEAAAQGSTIDINDIGDMTVYDVTAGAYPDSGIVSDVTSTKKQLTLSNFKAVTFKLTDKEIYEIQNGTVPRALEKSVRAMANQVDADLLALYKDVYNYVGTAGTTPFGSSTVEAQTASRILTTNLAPKAERYMVLDEFAYANALGLDVLQKVNESGDSETLRDAMISRAVGFDWAEDQNVATHTSTASGNYALDANATAGATTIVVDDDAGANPTDAVVGDIFNIAGDTTNYVITAISTATPTANEDTWTISPPLAANASDGDNITMVTSSASTSVQNLAFHREAFAFASRPMIDLQTPGSILQTLNDPISGLSMRYEIQRGWKETVFSLDMLYGVLAVRPSLACRIFG